MASPSDREALVTHIVQRVAELPDRTSPDDQPDMMLVTSQELYDILADALAALPTTEDDARIARIEKAVTYMAGAWAGREYEASQAALPTAPVESPAFFVGGTGQLQPNRAGCFTGSASVVVQSDSAAPRPLPEIRAGDVVLAAGAGFQRVTSDDEADYWNRAECRQLIVALYRDPLWTREPS